MFALSTFNRYHPSICTASRAIHVGDAGASAARASTLGNLNGGPACVRFHRVTELGANGGAGAQKVWTEIDEESDKNYTFQSTSAAATSDE